MYKRNSNESYPLEKSCPITVRDEFSVEGHGFESQSPTLFWLELFKMLSPDSRNKSISPNIIQFQFLNKNNFFLLQGPFGDPLSSINFSSIFPPVHRPNFQPAQLQKQQQHQQQHQKQQQQHQKQQQQQQHQKQQQQQQHQKHNQQQQLRSGGLVILQHNQFVHPLKDHILRSRIEIIANNPKSEEKDSEEINCV